MRKNVGPTFCQTFLPRFPSKRSVCPGAKRKWLSHSCHWDGPWSQSQPMASHLPANQQCTWTPPPPAKKTAQAPAPAALSPPWQIPHPPAIVAQLHVHAKIWLFVWARIWNSSRCSNLHKTNHRLPQLHMQCQCEGEAAWNHGCHCIPTWRVDSQTVGSSRN